MTNQELEKNIRTTLATHSSPRREGLSRVLARLSVVPVTGVQTTRYLQEIPTSNIINNTSSRFISVWTSKHSALVPSFILMLFIGMFAVPHHISSYGISDIAHENEAIEEAGIDDDDQTLFTSFDAPALYDLDTTQNDL